LDFVLVHLPHLIAVPNQNQTCASTAQLLQVNKNSPREATLIAAMTIGAAENSETTSQSNLRKHWVLISWRPDCQLFKIHAKDIKMINEEKTV
jgi:hypothetical protein